jgi:hypothetical protein
MAFLAGKGFVILNRKAEQGDQKAKDLLAKLDSIDQDEADRLFSEILGKGGGGGSKKEKKIKAPGASATDGQGEITEGAGEQAPTGKTAPKAKGEAPVAAPDAPTGEVKPKNKDLSDTISFFLDKKPKLSEFETEQIAKEYGVSVKKVKENINQVLRTKYDEIEKNNKSEIARTQEQTPKGKVTPKESKPADPLSNDNLKNTFDKYEGNVDSVLDDLREQQIDISNNDLQDIVEGFAAGYKYNPGEATDKIKQDVARNIQSNIQSDIEPNFQEIADEYGITAQEVQDVYNNEIKAGKQGTTIDTAGANVQPAGAFGDIEPETQQLAGIEKNNLNKTLDAQSKDEFIKQLKNKYKLNDAAAESWYENYAGPQAETEYTIASALRDYEQTAGKSNNFINEKLLSQGNVNDQSKQQARQRIDDIMQEGRGGVSLEEAEALSEEFGIPVDEIRALERKSQSEIAFPAPDQGEAIPADQDFDEQGNPIGNINDKEVADELGVDEQELAGLLGPNPLKTLGKTYQGAPWEEENIKNILQQAGGDKAKALELLKQQQANYKDKGPILKDQFLPGLIEQAAAGETNLSLPASDPTAEQLAETDSLFENTPEKEMVAAEQLAGQPADRKISESDARANEIIEGIASFTSGGKFELSDDDWNDYYNEMQRLETSSPIAEKWLKNNSPKEQQPATFEVADENNLTPDEFQRMDFEAGEVDFADIQRDEFGNPTNQQTKAREQAQIQSENVSSIQGDLEQAGAQGYQELLNEIDFDPLIITKEQIQQVAQKLQLEGKTPDQLADIRDGVVKAWTETPDRRYNDKSRTAMSAITAAIDQYIYTPPSPATPAAKLAGQGQQTKDKDTGNINGKQYSVELVNGKPVSGVIDGKGFSIDDDGVVTTRGGRGSKDFYEAVTSLKRMYQEGLQPREEAAKPAQAPAQIKQTAKANAQQATPQAAAATPQPQQQPGKIDRKKLEQAAGDLGVNADLLEGLLELLKKVR